MATLFQSLRQVWGGRQNRDALVQQPAVEERARDVDVPAIDIAPNDPLIAFFQSSPSPIEIDKLHLDSPTVRSLRDAGVKMLVPLVSQGELIGLLNLGPRLSQQEYSADDRALLNNLATQAAPAVRVAQLVRQQQAEVQARERIEQELRVARLIQQTLLPKDVPALAGWQMAAYYQPARAVGGDFYDFIYYPDGRLGIVIGDVSDKGVPAALVMATTRSVLRTAAQRLISPSEVLQQVNDLLCPDMPPKMFVTCLYAVLDPASGCLRYANAGHDLPYRRSSAGASELRATGMPLGLMPDMFYEEKEVTLEEGETVLLYSDGLVESHSPSYEMFGFPRLQQLIADHPGGTALVDFLLKQLASFTGPDWEQEDDVTLVTLQRFASEPTGVTRKEETMSQTPRATVPIENDDNRRTLAQFLVPSEQGNERLAMETVAAAVKEIGLPTARLERLKTAIAEATMNAIEHGNQFRADQNVSIEVLASKTELSVRVTDNGSGGQPIPETAAPDLESKLAGVQTPRGWGLFLIKNMVDELRVTSDDTHHTIELVMHLRGDGDVSEST
ncbi:MAG TPA: SpoIIE family protein phosphatase [Chloroflexota bacterium]|nr:SpoIIE family protein phosphatase [Chloroflexota bacterium]